MSSGISRVVRASIWLYVSQLVYQVSGFVYWLLLGYLIGPGELGEATAALGIASTISGLLSLGLGQGVTRFVGSGDLGTAAWALKLLPILSLIAFSSSTAVCALMGIALSLGLVAGLTATLTLVNGVLAGFARGLLETRPIALSTAAGHLVKVAVGVSLVWAGLGSLGVATGYLFRHITAFIVLLAFLLPSVKVLEASGSLRELLSVGIAAYTPNVIITLGTWLGILVLYGGVGAVETGLYYVASVLSGVIIGVPATVLGLMMPYLSGVKSGREKLASKALRISLAVSLPLAAVLYAYPHVILMLLRREYMGSIPILRVLLLILPLQAVNMSVASLLYAASMYRLILLRGLLFSTVSTVLYYPLAIAMDGVGVAIARLAGMAASFTVSLLVASKVNFKLNLRELALLCLIPGLPALAFTILNVTWILGAPVILAVSVLAYARLRLLEISDLRELSSVLPRRILIRVHPIVKPLLEFLYG